MINVTYRNVYSCKPLLLTHERGNSTGHSPSTGRCPFLPRHLQPFPARQLAHIIPAAAGAATGSGAAGGGTAAASGTAGAAAAGAPARWPNSRSTKSGRWSEKMLTKAISVERPSCCSAVGNALFKDGEHAHAIAVYGRAAARLCARAFAGRASDMDLDPDGGGFAIACASNAALCALKLGDARAALAHCDRALEALDRTRTPRDAARAKVLYRRALACLATGQARQALDHLGESAKLDASANRNRAKKARIAALEKELHVKAQMAEERNAYKEQCAALMEQCSSLMEQLRTSQGFDPELPVVRNANEMQSPPARGGGSFMDRMRSGIRQVAREAQHAVGEDLPPRPPPHA